MLFAATLGAADWIVLAVYLGGIVSIGMWFGKFTHTTGDFFFGGQRFSWWLVAISCIATLVGSYSFIQYSQIGFDHGFSSLIPYTNEWFVLPMLLIGWLPIIYYNRVASVPEYFERRFDRRTRVAVLVILSVYLQGYVSVNLLTIGQVLEDVLQFNTLVFAHSGVDFRAGADHLDWGVILLACGAAVLSGLYLHAGGQTSVLMTDLFQGLLLLIAGLMVVFLGIAAVGGWTPFWETLPVPHRLPFAGFNDPPGFHFIGNFWGDAITSTTAFWFINQGMMMRYLSARSVRDGRRAVLFVVIVLMPVAAIAVGGAGWVGRAMVEQGLLPADLQGDDAFVAVASHVCDHGLFGLVVAAVVAALMSTLDTLITAVSAVVVNDIWRLLHPGQNDAHYLRVARIAAVASAVLALAMLPVLQQLGSIYKALLTVINVSIPPLIVVMFLGFLWPRFSARAAFWTLVVGSTAMVLSLVFPHLIAPLAHGVRPDTDDAIYRHFSYMRGLYGLVVSLATSLLITLWDRIWDRTGRQKPITGLTLATVHEAAAAYKGGTSHESDSVTAVVLPWVLTETATAEVRLPAWAMTELEAEPGDLLYVSDARRWLGGFRSAHVTAGLPTGNPWIVVPQEIAVNGNLLADRLVRVMKLV
ncbi:MAG: sodium:solute symporter [Pirellulaceae bacterium]